MTTRQLRCVNLEKGLQIHPRGTCKSCCLQHGFAKDDSGNSMNVKTHSFEQILQSPTLSEIRQAFDRGIQHKSCKKCFDEEAAGKNSKRLRDNHRWHFLFEDNIVQPRLLDINMGTTCNIKCRTCTAASSSGWNKEYKDAGYFSGTDAEYKLYLQNLNNSFYDDSLFWKQFANHIDDISHIDFYGGEPFLVKKQWDMLQLAVDRGVAHQISIHYNTNGTIWDSSKESLLKQFKQVAIDFSIDGIEKQFEYMRHPAQWNTVLDNFKYVCELEKHNSVFFVSVCHTVSTLNVLHISDFLKYFYEFTDNIYLNLVHEPEWYCIKNIPATIKKQIKKNVNKNTPNSEITDPVLEFMFSEKNKKSVWQKFLQTTRWHDNYRKEDFQKTFSDFNKLIENNGFLIHKSKERI